MSPIAAVAAALAPIAVQDPHPFLDTVAGMAANMAAAAELGISDVQHLRTSEYVAATARTRDGQRVLLRAGHQDVSVWHQEELQIATAWAVTGRTPAPLVAELVATVHGSVSIWPFLRHDSTLEPHQFDAVDAGHALRALHDVPGADLDVFRDRGWRAPGKIARRLLNIAARHPQHAATWERLASAVAGAAGAVPAADMTTIHGDYQAVNWLATPDGLRVIDFATSGWGPAAWDLTLLEQRCRTGQLAQTGFWERFCHGYGASPTCLDGTAARSLRTWSHVVANLSHPADDAAFAGHLRAAEALLDSQTPEH